MLVVQRIDGGNLAPAARDEIARRFVDAFVELRLLIRRTLRAGFVESALGVSFDPSADHCSNELLSNSFGMKNARWKFAGVCGWPR